MYDQFAGIKLVIKAMYIFDTHHVVEYAIIIFSIFSTDDGRITLSLTNHSCLVEINNSKAIDNGTWDFFTGIGKDPQDLNQFQTTYTVVIKGVYSSFKL